MATAEGLPRAHGKHPLPKARTPWKTLTRWLGIHIDRNGRRRPFSSWMKRLASLKGSSESGSSRWSHKRHTNTKSKKSAGQDNNPYPLSGTINRPNQNDSYSEVGERDGQGSRSRSDPSLVYSGYENPIPATSAKSNAPTVSTNDDTAPSDAGYSKAGTLATGGAGTQGGGEGSTFSSPAPSVRSLTTTLTTVQSAAPSTQLYPAPNAQQGQTHGNGNSTQSSTNQQVQFSHQFPTSSSPATAVPPHVIPHSHSMTYSTATANNVLTDNASILTLASSSKRRRRNSLDTNASVRAMAPSSIFGGSRESLPLSVLSGNVAEPSNTSAFNSQGVPSRPSVVGLASAERISVYSSSGTAPMAGGSGERGSFYTSKQNPTTGDGASIRSGAPSHGRNDSTAASITGVGSPLAMTSGRVSRRSSGWGEIAGDEEEKGEIREEDDNKDASPPGTRHENSFNGEPKMK
ncbi:hypothetical protein N7532_007557 [Penicillium argentinense]|uniref:Uncharacterized protein n=1 Tax=Penicillium argentinense TaxID=1131581 RepID=A0A9W9K7F2_9EURO|nr:uncharacterized protein N7532_007557 [Penicillium argentinense]KAJ5095266.1 hypothetical protein N7532_007557 [Penicillium argentinense]